MKKFSFSLIVLFFSGCLFAQKQFVIDEHAEMRSIDKTFTSVKVSGSIELYLSQSDNEAVAVSASEEKYKQHIKTVVENNVLRVYFDGEKKWSKNRKLMVYVSFINIDKIQVEGASNIVIAGTIKVPSLHLQVSGASDFRGTVNVTSLKMTLSGASDVNISGTATNLNIESSGASDVKGYDLVTENCTAKASGASDLNFTVNKELNAHASGASNIYFRGQGVIKEIQSSGASTIARKGS